MTRITYLVLVALLLSSIAVPQAVGWMVSAAPASAQLKYLVALDEIEYGPGQTMTIRAMIPPDLPPDSLRFILARIGTAAPGTPLPLDPRVFQRFEEARIPAPTQAGEYEIHVLERGRLAGKSMQFRVVSRPLPPQPLRRDHRDSQLSAEGNWEIEWHDYPEKGQVTRAVGVLYRTWEKVCVEVAGGGCRYQNKLKENDNHWSMTYRISPFEHGQTVQQLSVSKTGEIKLEWGYHTLGHWGGQSELRQISSNEIRGNWRYGDRSAAEIWKRAPPRVTRVVLKSKTTSEAAFGGAPAKVQVDGWDSNNNRDVRANFDLEIYGENLWGHHLIDFGEGVDIEFSSVFGNNILSDGSRFFSFLYNPSKVIGIAGRGLLRQHATPGPKTINVDGIAVPFELVISGFPETESSVQTTPTDTKTAYGAGSNALP